MELNSLINNFLQYQQLQKNYFEKQIHLKLLIVEL